ncbi:Metallo-dependent phosphatase, partial [Saitoella complicata NRRL Y-17804]|uniref:Metallo-dependent phosphatase n=1 Tax=Saitoella complicata (strain BCRC 22490 / CBS 7301 / JCM 7358 / NBRC 10748 / NRRL Y-17804) TaxID=698492 RepID=UPI000867E742
IRDITVVTCNKWRALRVFGSCSRSGWERVDRDLFLRKGWIQQAFVLIDRRASSDDKSVIREVRSGRLAFAETGIAWEYRPGGIWIQREAAAPHDAVTGVDILYGIDAVEVRPGWSLVRGGTLEHSEAHLSIRHGVIKTFRKPEVRVNANGKFKVLQVADLHLSTSVGACRDAEPADTAANCEADPRTLEFLTRILDEEKPDMVVLTGDQINGDTAPDTRSAMYKFVEPLIARRMPYAAIFGNHDDEGDLTRAEQMKLLEGLPYSLSQAGPADIDGVGNYVITIPAANDDFPALTFYFIDTHKYSPDEKNQPGYDWIKQSQISWFNQEQAGRVEQKDTRHQLSMAFIHIPLPEYRMKSNRFIGDWREPPTAPTFNSGFQAALLDSGVNVVTAGHDHANEYCMIDDQARLWMCYAGGSGFGGYGGYNGFIRKLRIFDFDVEDGSISTYKRAEWPVTDERLDPQGLVGQG